METLNHTATSEFVMQKLFSIDFLLPRDKNECISVLLWKQWSLEEKVNDYLKNYYMMKYWYRKDIIERIISHFEVKFTVEWLV